MADEYLHGVRVLEISEGTRTIRSIATAVIGTVCTADDADPDVFPLDTPVLITDPFQAIAKAGKTGTLSRTLDAISDLVKTPCIIVRVADSLDENELTANIIGTVKEDGTATGMKAFLAAKSQFGLKPRILGVPKYDKLDVATELASVAKRLNGFAYISSHANTKEEAYQYAQNFSQRELMMIHSDFKSFNVATAQVEVDYAVARALGLRAYIDKEIGWHKNISNVAIDSVSDVTHPVSFDINDSSSDANFLNERNIAVALNFSGYRIWGARTLSSDKLFAFEQYTRTAQIIKDTISEAFNWAIDKTFTPTLVKDMIEMINAKFRFWKAEGYLVDGKAWVRQEVNTKDTIKDGKFFIDYDYTPMPSLENLNLYQRITDEYLVDFVASITQ